MLKYVCNNSVVIQLQHLRFISTFGALKGLKHYSTSTSTSLRGDHVNSSLARYLVKSLGLSKSQALLTSSKLARCRPCRDSKQASDFNMAENAHSVVNLFKVYGFDQTQIRNVVHRGPQILSANIEKALKPILMLLQDEGFSRYDAALIVCYCPIILKGGLDARFLPTIDVLRRIFRSDADVIAFLKNAAKWNMFSSVPQNLVKNITLLKSYGIPFEKLRKHLLAHPFPFLLNCKSFEGITVRVEEKLGIPRNSGLFLYGIKLLASVSENNFDSKVEVFKSFGWMESDVLDLCRRRPLCLGFSETLIKKKLGFLVNQLGLKPAYIVSKFMLFSCSLEKRVMPRHKILMALKEKRLIMANHSLGNAVDFAEPLFLRKFVLPFKEVHQVYGELTGITLGKQKRVEQRLGNPQNSGLFLCGTQLLTSVSEKTFDSKVEVFKSFGWMESDVSELCRRHSSCFTYSETSIKKKLDFLVNELGLKPAYITSNFMLLCCSLEKRVMPRHKIMMALKEKGLIKDSRSLGRVVNLAESLFLHKFVLPFKEIHQVYGELTGITWGTAIRVEQKLGNPRNSGSFLSGINLLASVNEKTFDSKMEVFKSFGWMASDVSDLCRRRPLCLGFSETLIKKKLDFLVNELGLKPAYIVSNFMLLTCSLEKRVMPRHKIMMVLKEKGLIKANRSFVRVVCLAESAFLHKFVLPFKEVHQVYTELTGITLDKSDVSAR